jgi:small subunit ribosomal protein S16
MVKIRLSRVGAKGQPYYRIVIVDERKKRDGAVIEVIGRYNPRTEPSTFEVDRERLKYWRGVGAQPTSPVLVLLGEAKPKFHQPRNKKEETPAVVVPATTPEAAVTPAEPLPKPEEASGEIEPKINAPETTPEPSPELAKVEETSEKTSPEAPAEVTLQTIENTENIVTQETLEKQPTTQDEKVAEAEAVEEEASEVEAESGTAEETAKKSEE